MEEYDRQQKEKVINSKYCKKIFDDLLANQLINIDVYD